MAFPIEPWPEFSARHSGRPTYNQMLERWGSHDALLQAFLDDSLCDAEEAYFLDRHAGTQSMITMLRIINRKIDRLQHSIG